MNPTETPLTWAELFSVDLWMFKPLDVVHWYTPMNLLALTSHLCRSDVLLHFCWWHCLLQSQLSGRDGSWMFGMAPVRVSRNLRAPRPAPKIGSKAAEAFVQHSSERKQGSPALWREVSLGLLCTCTFMLLRFQGSWKKSQLNSSRGSMGYTENQRSSAGKSRVTRHVRRSRWCGRITW